MENVSSATSHLFLHQGPNIYRPVRKGNKSSIKKIIAKRSKIYGLKVWAAYNPAYWLFLEMDHSAKLEDLDHFLRETWLECCGHLSTFTI